LYALSPKSEITPTASRICEAYVLNGVQRSFDKSHTIEPRRRWFALLPFVQTLRIREFDLRTHKAGLFFCLLRAVTKSPSAALLQNPPPDTGPAVTVRQG
jgi:hypothetical protein